MAAMTGVEGMVVEKKYLLGVIGSKAVNETDAGPSDKDSVFNYQQSRYSLVYDCNIGQLMRDVKKLDEFVLQEVVLDGETYLGLYFLPNPSRLATNNSSLMARKRIIDSFFSVPPSIEAEASEVVDAVAEPESANITQDYEKLYDLLRECHQKDGKAAACGIDVQHASLKPLLRPYQAEAVRWMLARETATEYVTDIHEKVFANAIDGHDFYLNRLHYDLLDHQPPQLAIPSGGILADEMGLGKTVEMLALILTNGRSEESGQGGNDKPFETVAKISASDGRPLKCVCRNSGRKNVILCTRCEQYQHFKCVKSNWVAGSRETVHNYICPKCWINEDLVESRATIIVSPQSIEKQWECEIAKHVSDANFKVLVYRGVTRHQWISPADLATYDVVITNYNVLKTEIYFTAVNSKEGSLRHARPNITPTSPLPLVKWWRVCLDEAQMVETPTSQCTRMVKTLPAIHRWAVTGTPIEKTINNLFGLMHFMDCRPYNEVGAWSKLATPFVLAGDPLPLVDGVLRKVMWRNSKKDVGGQIGIPAQTQLCHRIRMSDLQMIFYREQHEQCRQVFVEKAKKLNETATMAKWNPHLMKLLLEPLRKLRQDCTVPSVMQKGGHDQQLTKRLLSPDELYQHLVTNNEMECKAQLRTIASSLNGLAGVACLQSDGPLALRYYRAVLKRAEENTGTITVDSLLQIHALHNLLAAPGAHPGEGDADDGLSMETVEQWQARIRELEGKYIENYYAVMKSAENQLASARQPMNGRDYQQRLGSWWRYLLQMQQQQNREQGMLERISFEMRSNNFVNILDRGFTTTHGIDYILTTWLDSVVECRQKVLDGLEGFRFFTDKIRPGYVPSDVERQQIERFVIEVADCHLIFDENDGEEEDDDDDDGVAGGPPPSKVRRKGGANAPATPCQLCVVKLLLTEYECRIFDKTFNVDREEGDGTWKPSHQEWILKILQQHLKRESVPNEEMLLQADHSIQLVDKYRNEYKEMSKYWVEINYTASAFDELNMCKLQLEAVDPATLRKGEKLKRHQVLLHAVEMTKEEFQLQLAEAEVEYLRIKRTLAYLRHLRENPEASSCPICNLVPEDKYSVWECGHQLCIPCLLQMKKYHGMQLLCPVCRQTQRFKDINFVTLNNASGIHVEGRYSAKIIRIVQQVQELRQEDAKVKVLIFSQWEANLAVIQKALVENKIECRIKSHKFHVAVEEFKSATADVTCLLLPLAYGSKGLNLIEATHVFLVEPILNPSEELQAIGRVHRIGQTRPTYVHRFIVESTIEETIHNTISNDVSGKWKCKDIGIENLKDLFTLTVENK